MKAQYTVLTVRSQSLLFILILSFFFHAPLSARKIKNPIDILVGLNQLSWKTVGFIFGGKKSKKRTTQNNTPTENNPFYFQEQSQNGSNNQQIENNMHRSPNMQGGNPNDPKQPEEKKVTFNDIAGIDEIINDLKETVDFIKNPTKYSSLGAKVPTGILLVGAPGVGKTLIGQAMANEAGCNFLYASGSQFVEMYVGQGAARIRELFQKARDNKPAIIFIDEIDALGGSRSSNGDSGSKEYDQTLNQLLVEMQGFNRDSRIIIIGATNRPDILDPALKRPGRFTKIITIPMPNEEARTAIITHYLKKLPTTELNETDLAYFIKNSEQFSGAEIEDFINNAALLACRTNSPAVTQEHFYKAFDIAKIAKRTRAQPDKHPFSHHFVSSEEQKYGLDEDAVKFDDIAGLDSVIDQIKETVEYVKNPAKFRTFGLKVPRGILLEGPPGVGKSLIAQAMAHEAGCNFIYMSGSSFVEMYVGQGAARVRELFKKARENKPAIIFIDEIDAVGASRSSHGGGSKEYDQTLNQLLVEMQGFGSDDQVIIVGATNRADMLDPALKRPGRFTKVITIPLPDDQARKAILNLYLNKIPSVDLNGIDVSNLAKSTKDFNSAELEELVNSAALFAFRENAETVTKVHLNKAFEEAKNKRRKRGGSNGQPSQMWYETAPKNGD